MLSISGENAYNYNRGWTNTYELLDILIYHKRNIRYYSRPLKVCNETPSGVSQWIQEKQLPINELNGTPPLDIDKIGLGQFCLSNLHRCKPFRISQLVDAQSATPSSLITTLEADVLHQFSFNMPPSGAEMNGLDRLLCASSMRKGVNEKIYSPLRTLFLMIPYCRDIILGKGERDITYHMIYTWYQVFPVLALKAIYLLFPMRNGFPPIGSWCDVKYFCLFIEKISPLGLYDPLITVIVSIANRQLYADLLYIDGCSIDKSISNVSKWIPRESHHSELFSIFVRNWFSLHYVDSGKKKLYRQIISRLSSYSISYLDRPSVTRFIGEYVRSALRCISFDHLHADVISINQQWNRLLLTFSVGPSGLAIVDIDISLSDEQLFHSLGFACFISEKMGLKRILLAGPSLVCVDISECDGFVSIISLLWSHCEIRGKSNVNVALSSIESGLDPDLSLRLFIFSNKFDFDWSMSFFTKQKREVVLWNLSPTFSIPDHEKVDHFIYMSGYSLNLMTPFFSFDNFSLESLLHTQYPEWVDYFDLFIHNIVSTKKL